jgi:hypothetical protein
VQQIKFCKKSATTGILSDLLFSQNGKKRKKKKTTHSSIRNHHHPPPKERTPEIVQTTKSRDFEPP